MTQTHAVNSSVLATIFHDAATLMLELVFRDGARYRYFTVPAEVFRDLLTAPSAGTFFNCRIRNHFPYRFIREPL